MLCLSYNNYILLLYNSPLKVPSTVIKFQWVLVEQLVQCGRRRWGKKKMKILWLGAWRCEPRPSKRCAGLLSDAFPTYILMRAKTTVGRYR